MPEQPLCRTVLPIPDRPPPGAMTFDAKDPDTRFAPIRDLRPPKGAPNSSMNPLTVYVHLDRILCSPQPRERAAVPANHPSTAAADGAFVVEIRRNRLGDGRGPGAP